MGLEYLQLWSDMEEYFQPFNDEQRGRLIMAMMAYAYRGEEPEFEGVEKFIWPVLKKQIDRCAQSIEAKKAAGSKGGSKAKTDKQTEADGSSAKQTEAKASRAKQTEADGSKGKQNAHTNTHDHEYDHDNNKEEVVVDARARATAPAAAADEIVTAFDGEDMTQALEAHREAERLIKRYRLTDNDRTMDALVDDIAEHGLAAVEEALENATDSDSRGGISIRYYRAFLGTKTRPEPNTSARAPDTTNPFLQMLREEGYGI